jgi:plasmid stabilization system protein ParE
VEVKWSPLALSQLVDILDYITEKGFDSYSQVLEENIISKTDNLINNYSIYPVDKYKRNNNNSYHAFEIDEYRISYKVMKTAIKIIRIRHTSRKTRKY